MPSSHRPLRIVAVSGGLQRPSRATLLAEHLLGVIGNDVHCEHHLIELGELAPCGAHNCPRLSSASCAVEQADVLVVSTPVYRGSYTGLFKHFFDFIHQDALVDTPILLAATGGSERHALVIDHQLRPLFSFFQAHPAAGRLCHRPRFRRRPRAQRTADRARSTGGPPSHATAGPGPPSVAALEAAAAP